MAAAPQARETVARESGFKTNPDYKITFERSPRRVRVEFNGETIADSTDAHLLFETRHLPVYYFPRADVRMDLMTPDRTPHLLPVQGDGVILDGQGRRAGPRKTRSGAIRAVRGGRRDRGFRRLLLGPGRSLVRGG